MNQRELGTSKEQQAMKYLQDKGAVILTANFRCKTGEIDLVINDEGYLVFVEVKYRRDERAGSPAEAVTIRKQKIICQVSDYYKVRNGYGIDTPCRYDIVAITGSQIEWIKNAFYYVRF